MLVTPISKAMSGALKAKMLADVPKIPTHTFHLICLALPMVMINAINPQIATTSPVNPQAAITGITLSKDKRVSNTFIRI